MFVCRLPKDIYSILEVLIQQEFVRQKDRSQWQDGIHQFTEKESESVAIEFVVDVFLEVFQHSTDFLISIVYYTSSRSCKRYECKESKAKLVTSLLQNNKI